MVVLVSRVMERYVSFWLYPGLSATPTLEVTSDAAGALGYGAYFETEWFNGVWLAGQKPLSIAYKELFRLR